jgi:hypothetical protein
MLVGLNGLLIFRPEPFPVLNAQSVRQRFESGDVLEDREHHLVELTACQSPPNSCKVTMTRIAICSSLSVWGDWVLEESIQSVPSPVSSFI